jgi:hypothetical protein
MFSPKSVGVYIYKYFLYAMSFQFLFCMIYIVYVYYSIDAVVEERNATNHLTEFSNSLNLPSSPANELRPCYYVILLHQKCATA